MGFLYFKSATADFIFQGFWRNRPHILASALCGWFAGVISSKKTMGHGLGGTVCNISICLVKSVATVL